MRHTHLQSTQWPTRFCSAALLSAVLALIAVAPASTAAQGPPIELVTICHFPGTPGERTLNVPQAAVAPHLAHGDQLGECGANACPCFTEVDVADCIEDATDLAGSIGCIFTETTANLSGFAPGGIPNLRVFWGRHTVPG
jgi:hypothetical protein